MCAGGETHRHMSYMEIFMKARKNPTDEQLARRLRRPPVSCHDPRFEKDAYWAARKQDYPHVHAKRVFRDQPPEIIEHVVTASTEQLAEEYGCEPDEILFKTGSTWPEVKLDFRPLLTEEVVPDLKPRRSEYTVWDDQARGLGVRVRTSGYKSYICLYRLRFQKKLHKITIGNVGEFSLADAREIAKGFRREARMGSDPAKRLRRFAESN